MVPIASIELKVFSGSPGQLWVPLVNEFLLSYSQSFYYMCYYCYILQGMIQAAIYVRNKLRTEKILQRSFMFDPARGTENYDIVLVGHSLGAGTASILAILLKQEYKNLTCFGYSPPGGLLRYDRHTKRISGRGRGLLTFKFAFNISQE